MTNLETQPTKIKWLKLSDAWYEVPAKLVLLQPVEHRIHELLEYDITL